MRLPFFYGWVIVAVVFVTMGIGVSHEEPKLDALSDTLENLIRAKANIKGREAEIQAPGFDLASLA